MHEHLIRLAANMAATLEANATALAANGIDAAAMIQDLSRTFLDEERREGDGCLRRLNGPGALLLRSAASEDDTDSDEIGGEIVSGRVDVPSGRPARVVNVVDGNVLDLEMDLGGGKSLHRCRLDGVVSPAMDDPDPEERKVAEHAKDFIEVLVLEKQVAVRLTGDPPDEDGRWLAVIYWQDAAGDWSNLNEDMVENGLAAPVESDAGEIGGDEDATRETPP